MLLLEKFSEISDFFVVFKRAWSKGPFKNYVDNKSSQKMSVFVHPQGIKTVHEEGDQKWQNSVHVVVECPLISIHMSTLVISKPAVLFKNRCQI